jgi:hypothetical protein
MNPCSKIDLGKMIEVGIKIYDFKIEIITHTHIEILLFGWFALRI